MKTIALGFIYCILIFIFMAGLWTGHKYLGNTQLISFYGQIFKKQIIENKIYYKDIYGTIYPPTKSYYITLCNVTNKLCILIKITRQMYDEYMLGDFIGVYVNNLSYAFSINMIGVINHEQCSRNK